MSETAKSYEAYEKYFDTFKSQQKHLIEDASRKSSIDDRIVHLVNRINASDYFFTTSSCSGRFLAFAQSEEFVKKNCEWIKVTHEPLSDTEIKEMINRIEEEKANHKMIFLKFEPFILHICCRNLDFARSMLKQCIASGLRNSGISIGNSKIILAVRSTQSIECPVSNAGKLIVDHQYIEFVCQLANEKFAENFDRIKRFSEHAEEAFLAAVPKEVSAKKEKIPFDKKKKSPSNKESAKLDDSTSSIDLECFDGMNLYD